MSWRACRTCVPSLAVLLALVWLLPSPAAAEDAAGKNGVTLTLKISDKKTGFTLEAKKAVPSGSNAFDVLRHTVAVTYRSDPELGPLVTGLCGVTAPKGLSWMVYVDGKPSPVGIGRVTLTRDTVIEWKIRSIDDK
jgi:hypothetical protein